MKVFIYDDKMKDLNESRILDNAKLVEKDELKGELFFSPHHTAFPVFVRTGRGNKETVKGEVYSINNNILKALLYQEGYTTINGELGFNHKRSLYKLPKKRKLKSGQYAFVFGIQNKQYLDDLHMFRAHSPEKVPKNNWRKYRKNNKGGGND